MSLHNNPKYQIPALVDALKQHGLAHNTPSQLADAFRTGWVAALATPAQAAPDSIIMASVMRDDGGERPAFCLMVAYRAEKDAKAALAMLTDEPAQAAAPDMTDAYAGAREDLSIWKKRALEAEALNHKFATSVNSPSFMREPAAPIAPAREPLTDSQIADIYFEALGQLLREQDIKMVTCFARAVEQAHGIKATNPESNK